MAHYADFLKKYKSILPERTYHSDIEECQMVFESRGFDSANMFFGATRLFVSYQAFKSLEDELGTNQSNTYTQSVYSASIVSEDQSETESHYSSEFEFEQKGNDVEGGIQLADLSNAPLIRAVPKPKKVNTKTRNRWVCCVYLLTWWVPPCCMSMCGIKRKDQQIAWREKLALCLCILFLCVFILFIIIGLSFILCPNKLVISPGEASSSGRILVNKNPTVYMYGNYYQFSPLLRNDQYFFQSHFRASYFC